MKRSASLIVVAVVALIGARSVTAQPLADRIPADAVIYIGWTGAESMGPGFEGSHLKAMLDEAEVPRIVNEIIPKLLDRLIQEEPDAREPIDMIRPILEPVWRHPTALYVGPVDITDIERPVPRLALLCQAGEQAAAMERQLEGAIQQAGDLPFAVSVRTVGGNVVVLTVGDVKNLDAVVEGKAKEKALGASKNFAAAMAMQKSPVIAAYVDAEAIVKLVDEAVAKGDDNSAKREWPNARNAIGLGGLKRLAFAQGFDGKDWGTHAFIEAPAPRPGILAALDAKPVSDDALRAIPASATMAGVARADLAGLFDAVRSTAEKLEPQAKRDIDEGIKQFNDMLGLDLRKDLLGSLGDEWAYYIAPEMTGHGPLGVVIVNRLKDGAKASEVSDKLRDAANQLIEREMRDPDVKFSFKQAKVDGVTINYLATPFVTPSWVIANGNLYFGLYPQLVAQAAGHVSREGKSILDNAGFVALRKRLGGEGRAVSLQFYDLPKSAPTSYQLWMMAASLGKFGDIVGVDTPVMLLPPLSKLTQHLAPSGSVSWVDEKGWHFRAVSPFPGATLVASETAGLLDVQVLGVLAGLALPAVGQARVQATQVKGLSNLRQIGLGLHLYSNEHKGRFPAKLSETLQYFNGDVGIFVNPETGAPPPAVVGDEAAAWIDDQSGYVYLLPGRKMTDIKGTWEVIAVHEKPRPGDAFISAVFADGHAEAMPLAQFQQRLAAQNKPAEPRAD